MANGIMRAFDVFLMITMILFWGSSFVVVKKALAEGLTPIAIATYRFLIAGSLFMLVLAINKIRHRDYKFAISSKDFPVLLILALTGVTFFFIAQYTGIQMASASLAAILVCFLSPILITVFSSYIYGESLVKQQILGIGAAALGTFVVVTEGSLTFGAGNQFLSGALILLLTPFLWATYSLLGKGVLAKYSPFVVVAYVNMLGGLLLVPFSLVEDSLSLIFSMSIYGWLAILFLSVTCSFIGYSIWFYELSRVKAAVTSSFLFAEPLVTVSFAIAFIGEKVNVFTVVGALLIFVGVFLVSIKQELSVKH